MPSTYLLTAARTLRLFSLAEDREYFSRPVPVEPIYCEISTRFVFVRDASPRAKTYPVNARDLVDASSLSRRQRQAVGL